MIQEHDTFASAYVSGLEALLSRGAPVESVLDESSIGSEFGTRFRPTLELRPFAFRVRDPHACLIECERRQPDLGYTVGQWIWTMAGSDDVSQIAYYNRRGHMFSEDGARLAGAFGARMRRSAGDQLERTISLLRRDPGSRRAIIAIAEASDSRSPMLDHPCAIAVHFLLRERKLEAITTMRSQSALMVLPYDAALFMMLQVWIAAELGVECGSHTWIANSFHVYEDELPLAHEVRRHGVEPGRVPSRIATPPSGALERLLALEGELRALDGETQPEPLPEELADPAEFHGALASVLVARAISRSRDPSSSVQARSRLPESWQSLWQPKPKAPA
jgi:thymidylate synthase